MTSFAARLFLDGTPLLRRGFDVLPQNASSTAVNLRYVGAQAAQAPDSTQQDHPKDPGIWCGYADGAWRHQPLGLKHQSDGLSSLFWCGDGDSLHGGQPQQPAGSRTFSGLKLDPNKDLSDGAALMEHCARHVALSSRTVTPMVEVVGAFGGRRDQELANLLEIEHVFFQSIQLCVVVAQPSCVLANVMVGIEGLPWGTRVSVFCKDTTCELQMSGLEHSGALRLQRPSHGLSNRVVAPRIEIGPRSSGAAFFQIVIGHDEQGFYA